MEPFYISDQSKKLVDQHPKIEEIIAVLESQNDDEIQGLCRLWLSEGIPSAFLGQPMLYEIARDWTARRINIHPKELTLIGSARIGYSLAPGAKTGRSFGSHSDLDLAAISSDLFERCEQEFLLFRNDLQEGTIIPKTKKTAVLWPEIAGDIERTRLHRGFIDIWKVPNLDRYPLTQRIAQTCWLMRQKIEITNGGFLINDASLRVYRDFPSFIRQLSINLRAIRDSRHL